ncbi:MAG: ImmA/IrrE family metallo-endopeptidase [Thermoanaerobacteraceae bacterium]|uniref:HTH cro/C1-type domain-containing protein n=1 Tax=Thermoclostridium stercorarium (strain ATCC 35414 / DSM 8532 / NCIMB 11754) TaxID=1121335 RepID=L7VHE2_THES1|nr:XRE family transcriptional regulator [Thermoclostridium stercorarium]AGC67455.1 hypothetical protein Cst_c04330 [Thermoclostridium stercorarium subsp. stercorarium DSM 8532]AGI38515.1 zinc peptidase [Thermoclostridium stercorarium subsp. stercorarium DSM 8532]NLZ53247.1 ImmA/IrrE family metallo-endopeptidase [Thermoanaerobacteraceae bacterium]
MDNVAKIIGSNIRHLIEQNNVPISDIAQKIGVTRQTMSKYLNGESIIDSEKLFIIANYFGKPITYFLEKEHDEELSFMFRAHNPSANISMDEINRIQSRMEKVYEAYRLAGEKMFYIPEQYNLEFELERRDIPEDIEKIIERIANEQRDILDVGESVGKDLIKCFEAKGINIIFEKMNNPKLWGISAFHPKKGCFIFVNDDEDISEERKIFSMVHEYAHLIFHRDQYKKSQDSLQYSDFRSEITEKIANLFAGYFLIPRDCLKRHEHLLKNGITFGDLLFIKRELQVSLQALIYALRNYGYISEETQKKVMEKLYKYGYGTKEPRGMSYIPKNEKFFAIVRSLYFKEIIGESKVAELLNLKVKEARKKIKEWMENEWFGNEEQVQALI